MKRTKAQKGITLVALIITIIVLLILAVVAINAVQDDGIIEYAKNARNDYQRAQTNESALLGNYTNYIKENVSTVEIITFYIDEEEYTAEEGMTWEDWIRNSSYNTAGYGLDANTNVVTDSTQSYQIEKEGTSGLAEYESNLILNGHKYHTNNLGGAGWV